MKRAQSKQRIASQAANQERCDRLKSIMIEWGPLSWSELQEVSGYNPNQLYATLCRCDTKESFQRCGGIRMADSWWLA